MEVTFNGGLPEFWYDTWLVLAGFGASLLLGILAIASSRWQGPGLLLNIVMILAVLAGLPLTMVRLGIDVAVTNYDPIGYMSFFGTFIAVAVGLAYLRMRPFDASQPAADAMFSEPAQQTEGVSTLTDILEPSPLEGTLASGATPVPGEQMLAEAPTAWLHFESGSMAGQTMPLGAGVTTIGRAEDNDVVMEDNTVSRHHARISLQGGQFFVEDEGSGSGTLVEGAPAARTLLASGATLQVGETQVMFMQAGPSSLAGTAAGQAGTQSGAAGRASSPGETVVLEREEGVMAWLAVTAGPSKGSTYQLRMGDNTLGREGADMTIRDPSVSRRHAMVKVQDGDYLLVDLGSRSGTKVGDTRLQGKVIQPGGVVELGRTRLSLVEVEPDAAPPPGTISGETIVGQPGGGSTGILVVQTGPDAGKSYSLGQGDNLIGRDSDSAVLLTDDATSRRHALIRREEDRFVIFDLGSRTGTRVDGDALGGHRLSAGESISMGNSTVVLMQTESQEG